MGKFQKGAPKRGGRRKGTPNKFTGNVRQAFLEAFENMGGIPALTLWAKKEPTEFYRLISKLLPSEVNATFSAFDVRNLQTVDWKKIPIEALKRIRAGEAPIAVLQELNWLVEGGTSYKAKSLQIPERVRLASKAYREESDTVQQFLQECTVEGEQVNTTELYQAFQEWSGSAMSQKAFFQAIGEE